MLRDALVDTVRKHLISDVRVGSCLSGGLDSSTLVGVIGKIARDDPGSAAALNGRLFTFTSCFDQKAFDEREYALAVAHSVGRQTTPRVSLAGRLLGRFRTDGLAPGYAVRRAQLLRPMASHAGRQRDAA